MGSYLLIDDKDMKYIWETIQNQQIIFHPVIAPFGEFDYERFFAFRSKKPFVLFIDRNILISLLKFCEKGSLKNKGESQLVGLIMTWAEMNGIGISAGLAIRERASQLQSQEAGLIELQKYLEIFEAYPSQMWLEVAEGHRTEIPPIAYSLAPAGNVTVDYTDAGDHYDMAVATLLCAVRLYRTEGLTAAEKLQAFFQWMYDNLLISEYLLVYAAMLFTGQDSIKAPRHSNANDIDKIVAGCKNQAWDIAYLTNWSVLYSNSDYYDREFLFATNDILLKRIFVNKNGPNGYSGLFYVIFSKKEYKQIMDFIEEKMENREKPDFGPDAQSYFQRVIDEEKRLLCELLCSKDKTDYRRCIDGLII